MKTTYNKILKSQILLTILFAVLLLIVQHDLLNLLYIIFLSFSFLFIYIGFNRKSHILNIVVLPYTFLSVYNNIFKLIIKIYADWGTVLYVAYFIGMLALLIPVILYDYGTIKNPIWQLVATVWLIISLFLTPLISIEGNAVIVGLNKSNLLMALIFLEYAYIAITTWGYKFYFNLKISNPTFFYYLFLLVLGIVTVWISFFNTFILSASEWNQAIWNWDFSLINPINSAIIKNIWQLYFSALDAGIMEESARYVFLITLLIIFSRKKGRATYSILLSSIIFSLLHILNFSTPGANIDSILFQIFHAFGFGCLLGVILLYSGKLWLTMLFHTFADFLNFSLIPLGYGGSLASNENTGVIVLIVVTVIPLIILMIILENKKTRAFIETNIKKTFIFSQFSPIW